MCLHVHLLWNVLSHRVLWRWRIVLLRLRGLWLLVLLLRRVICRSVVPLRRRSCVVALFYKGCIVFRRCGELRGHAMIVLGCLLLLLLFLGPALPDHLFHALVLLLVLGRELLHLLLLLLGNAAHDLHVILVAVVKLVVVLRPGGARVAWDGLRVLNGRLKGLLVRHMLTGIRGGAGYRVHHRRVLLIVWLLTHAHRHSRRFWGHGDGRLRVRCFLVAERAER
mmetsp:Transcript_9366/g.28418  ORF Transcript_9366/g.28418 Transcript_9366/m.28418 type:complete len:223 (-) Transcript_9366:2044-2712(-)